MKGEVNFMDNQPTKSTFAVLNHRIAKTIADLKSHNLIDTSNNIIIVFTSEPEELVYSVAEVAKLLKTGKNRIYSLIDAGYLPALNFGSKKIRKSSLVNFLEEYENKDLSDI